tara:strand:+ start:473 stop:865 length:393 start_codon:yes stop_codon:yes gene_type:complete
MILDTDFVIDVMNGKENALSELDTFEMGENFPKITAITVFELFSGIPRSSMPDHEKEKVVKTISHYSLLPLNQDDAEKAGNIFGELMNQGHVIEAGDAMIAGIALNRQEAVLTRNVKHFKKIPGLQVETY